MAAATLVMPGPASAQQPAFRAPLVDRLQGRWVAEGTIAGEHAVHDVEGRWVVAHQYLRLHEVARERCKDGRPRYEGVIHIGWNARTRSYGCVWLDDFGGLNTQSIGSAGRMRDSLPFVFGNLDGSRTRTTMTYHPADGSWTWTIDEDRDGKLSRFAALTMRRAR